MYKRFLLRKDEKGQKWRRAGGGELEKGGEREKDWVYSVKVTKNKCNFYRTLMENLTKVYPFSCCR